MKNSCSEGAMVIHEDENGKWYNILYIILYFFIILK